MTFRISPPPPRHKTTDDSVEIAFGQNSNIYCWWLDSVFLSLSRVVILLNMHCVMKSHIRRGCRCPWLWSVVCEGEWGIFRSSVEEGREGGRVPLYIGNLFWARNDDFCKEEESYGQISH